MGRHLRDKTFSHFFRNPYTIQFRENINVTKEMKITTLIFKSLGKNVPDDILNSFITF